MTPVSDLMLGIINDKEPLAVRCRMLFKKFFQKFIGETAPSEGALFETVESIFTTGRPLPPAFAAKAVNRIEP